MSDGRIPAVFDCMVFLQAAARKNGPAAACLDLVRTGTVKLYLSEEVVAEVERVFRDSRFRQRFSELTDEMIEAFLMEITEVAEMVAVEGVPFRFDRDPKDEKYISLAIYSDANYIVSRDSDLLDLMTGFDDSSKDFRRRFRSLKVMEPLSFLNLIRYDLSVKP